jgi:DNA-binding MarR family transcriptional regulator
MSLADDFAAFEELSDHLFSLHRRRIDGLLDRLGLSPSQALALVTLHEAGELKMSPLADRLGLSPGAATSLIERMVELGLVARRRLEEDRRAVCVHLTEQGEQLMARAIAAKRDMAWSLFQCLPDDARRNLLTAMEALRTAHHLIDATEESAS